MGSLSRRNFLRAFAGAVATVAIGMRVSQGMPRLLLSDYLTDPDAWYLAEEVPKLKVNLKYSYDFRDWRAAYGSPASE